tara:strand:+ start:1417 stop:1674 length:258 start_codon:yes stop_codon:yes gene_type:complete
MKQYYDVMRRDYIKTDTGFEYRYLLVKSFSNRHDAKMYALKCSDGEFYWYTERVDELSASISKDFGDTVCSVGYIIATPQEQLTF